MNYYTTVTAPAASVGTFLAGNIELISQASTLVVQIVIAVTALVGLFFGKKN